MITELEEKEWREDYQTDALNAMNWCAVSAVSVETL